MFHAEIDTDHFKSDTVETLARVFASGLKPLFDTSTVSIFLRETQFFVIRMKNYFLK